MAYDGSVELISGIRQANNGSFALVDASAVRISDSKRLDAYLTEFNNNKANVSDVTSALATKVDKNGSEFTGAISMGRKDNTTVGANSVAVGYNVEASATWTHAEGINTKASESYAHAEGIETTASGSYAHAEGSNTTASGTAAHAEGHGTIASNIYSHAEGINSKATGSYAHAEGGSEAHGAYSHAEGCATKTEGEYSHSEGLGTIATGWYSHTAGRYNVASHGYYSANVNDYESDHAYVRGDLVNLHEVTQDSKHRFAFYVCIEPHTSTSTFDPTKWYLIDERVRDYASNPPTFWYWPEAEIIGNGLDGDNRANARALSWTGDEFLRGNLYVQCDANSTNGKKVATQEYVDALEQRIAALEAAIQTT